MAENYKEADRLQAENKYLIDEREKLLKLNKRLQFYVCVLLGLAVASVVVNLLI